MRGSVRQHVEAVIRGIRAIINPSVWGQIQRIVSPSEFDLLLCGLQEVDLADWKNNSTCGDGVDQDTWETFWGIAEQMTPQQRKDLLEFVTGSSGAPVGGFAALPGYGSIGSVQRFTIARGRGDVSLPVAATCFNTLYLPKYNSATEMSEALQEAIANRNTGGFYEGAVAQ